MKRIAMITALALLLFGCGYEDYKIDHVNTAVYFPQAGQTQIRSFVVNEVHTIEVGVVLGGRRENRSNETADFIIDESIITNPGHVLLPQAYYTLSNNSQFQIPSGSFQGSVQITITPEFFADPMAQTANYVLPFRLSSTSLDSILEGKETLLLRVRYEAELFGNYYHNGVTHIRDSNNNLVETIIYHQQEPVTNAVNNWRLTTLGPHTLKTNGIGYLLDGGTKQSFNIGVDTNHTINVMTNPESTITITNTGNCSYNAGRRELYLEYSFTNAQGNHCHSIDTLIFRNRILDGVNQWRGF